MKLIEETPCRFRIEQEGAMRVPGIVFASRALLPDEHEGMAMGQVANVATLPGIVRGSFAMPDVHWGYGFPIGGVAATDAVMETSHRAELARKVARLIPLGVVKG